MGVDGDDTDDAAQTFLRRHPVPYPSFADPDKALANAVGTTFVGGFPNTLFFDADGGSSTPTRASIRIRPTLEADIEKYALAPRRFRLAKRRIIRSCAPAPRLLARSRPARSWPRRRQRSRSRPTPRVPSIELSGEIDPGHGRLDRSRARRRRRRRRAARDHPPRHPRRARRLDARRSSRTSSPRRCRSSSTSRPTAPGRRRRGVFITEAADVAAMAPRDQHRLGERRSRHGRRHRRHPRPEDRQRRRRLRCARSPTATAATRDLAERMVTRGDQRHRRRGARAGPDRPDRARPGRAPRRSSTASR